MRKEERKVAPQRRAGPVRNVGDTERMLSVLGGGFLALRGLCQGDLGGAALALAGGSLLYRGLTGHCSVYSALGMHTTAPEGRRASVAAGQGVKVVRAVTIDRPAAELYAAWRDFECLPQFMRHLVSVRQEGQRSHWVARAPAGATVAWDAEIVNEEPGRLIAWRSLPGAPVALAGSVHFTQAPAGRGTEVRVELKYDPPGGRAASWLAWLLGEEPSRQIREDLLRFKQLHEAGEIATVQGQPSGHR
jgi:uncharacterized membrane protein